MDGSKDINLTELELSLLKLVAAGMTSAQIAKERSRSRKTIETQMAIIRAKTGIKKMPLLIATLIRQKLID